MKYRKTGKTYVVSIEAGEEIVSSLRGLAKEERIRGARISGIGSLEDVELGFHLPEKGRYRKQFFTGQFDLNSLLGNISFEDASRPFLHVHAVIGDENFRTFSGHLLSAKVLTTAEIFIYSIGDEITSTTDDAGGASPWQL